MHAAILSLLLLLVALPSLAAPPPEKPGAALAAPKLPPCDYKPDYWTPVGSLSKPLAAGDYAAVEAELEELHASFERNHACENRMLRAFLNGFLYTDELPTQLDRWVAARPDSWTAHTLRGWVWTDKAWLARGGSQNHRVSQEMWQATRAPTQLAVADLERAIQLYPRAVVAHAALIHVGQLWYAQDRVEAAFRRAVAIDPLSVHLLSTMLTALQPMWGGSLERTNAIVAEARRREKENPRLARVYGYPPAWLAQQIEVSRFELTRAERERVILLYSQALRHAEVDSHWHFRRASTYRDLGECESAITDAHFALATVENKDGWWGIESYCLAELGRFDEALRVAREGRKHVPDSLDLRWYEANAIFRMGRYDEAAALHRASLEHTRVPHQRGAALGGLAVALMKAGRYADAEPVYAEAARLSPWHAMTWHELAELRWQLGRYEEAVPAYEAFLAKSQGKAWAAEKRMRAQERIDVVREGAAPAARAPTR